VPAVVEALVEGGEIKVSVAREILAQLRADDQS
jgi:hypothetical protein